MNTAKLNEYEGFQRELHEYLISYEATLSRDFKKATVNKHAYIIAHCIDYICTYYEINGFEDIRFSYISSRVYNDFVSETQENISKKTMFNIIKRFFEYIQQEHGVSNPALMKKIASAKI